MSDDTPARLRSLGDHLATYASVVGSGVCDEAADRIEELEAVNRELLAALDHLEDAVRLADQTSAMTVGFVWAQNRDHILTGRSTWADQKVSPPTFGGMTFDATPEDGEQP